MNCTQLLRHREIICQKRDPITEMTFNRQIKIFSQWRLEANTQSGLMKINQNTKLWKVD